MNYETVAKDVSSLIRAAPNDPNSKYLAQFYSLNTAPEGRIFIVEELLARPLDRLAPLNDLTQFVRISRDLSRGLLFLHKHGLVHRDLKLDNCGLDHQQQAKIFDLGSVTSEPGDVLGTILTRAPELFVAGAKCDNVSDVWALGATLFALRTGDYPFVNKSEIEERRLINLKIREGSIDEREAQSRKRVVDAKIRDRIIRPEAEKELTGLIHGTFRGRTKDILSSMLRFNRDQRGPICAIEKSWSLLAREFAGTTGTASTRPRKWEQIKIHLSAAMKNETLLTTKQLDKVISEYEVDKPSDQELKNLIRQVKDRMSSAK